MIGALDIGGTKIAAGIVDPCGQVLAYAECPTDADKGYGDGLQRMTDMLRQTASQAGETIQGIGIGCTGPVDPLTGILGEIQFMPSWSGAHLVDDLTKTFGVTAAIENDADAAALGECAWGAGQGSDLFMLVTVGTGIGAGLVVNGKLYRGVNGAHPEIGHHIIDPSGPLCFCGGRGCWESLASGPALEHWMQANDPAGGWYSARQVCEAARERHPLAITAVERTATYLGLGMANLVTLYTPQMIALGGGLMQSLDLFLPTIQHTIRTTCGLVPHAQVRVIPAALGARTGLVGAAQVWYNRFA